MMAGFGRQRLASPATANVLAGFAVVVVAAVIWLGVLTHTVDPGQGLESLLFSITFGAVGLVVARAQPRNPVGWLMLGAALALALSSAAGSYAVLVYRLGHRTLPLGAAAVLVDLLWAPVIVTFGVIILLFPDGRLTRWWRRVLWAYLAVAVCWPASIYAVAVGAIAGHHIQVESGGDLTIVDSPTGSAAWLTTAQGLILPLMVVFWVLILARQATRYRGASGEERAQLSAIAQGCTTTELADRVGISLAAASQHASVLRDAGLITTRRQGSAVLHVLTPLGAELLRAG
jgi:Helix-turn-helix domain